MWRDKSRETRAQTYNSFSYLTLLVPFLVLLPILSFFRRHKSTSLEVGGNVEGISSGVGFLNFVTECHIRMCWRILTYSRSSDWPLDTRRCKLFDPCNLASLASRRFASSVFSGRLLPLWVRVRVEPTSIYVPHHSVFTP